VVLSSANGGLRRVKIEEVPMARLQDRVVTGEAQGLGEGIARHLSEEGASVVIATSTAKCREIKLPCFGL